MRPHTQRRRAARRLTSWGAGEAAHPQMPCPLGVPGLLDGVQGIQCREASLGTRPCGSAQAPGSPSLKAEEGSAGSGAWPALCD